TIDSCDPQTGECQHEPKDCDDGDLCTIDSCDPQTGECVHTPGSCDDGDLCTIDSCDPQTGECIHTPVSCDDGDLCTIDSCDPQTGECVHTPVSCDDGDPCTIDTCDPATGCVYTPVCRPTAIAPDYHVCEDTVTLQELKELLLAEGAGCEGDCGLSPVIDLSQVDVNTVGAYPYTVSCGDQVCGDEAAGTIFIDFCGRFGEPEVTVTPGLSELCPGFWQGYTIRIQNVGDLPLTGVLVTDILPDVPFSIGDVGAGHYDGLRTITWEIGLLGPGQVALLQFQIRLWSSVPPGTVVVNCVAVSSDQGASDSACAEVAVLDCRAPTPTPLPQLPCPVCPDWVVFQSNRQGDNNNIFRMDYDGGNVVQLTNNPAEDVSPTWSFDGSRIAFATNRDGDWEIYRMDENGGGQTNVTKRPLAVDGRSPSNDLAPSWNCEWIAFQSDRDGNWEIYKTDPAGATQIRLTNHPAMDQAPAWSPDGNWIAFQSNRDGNWEIYIMYKDGGNLRRVTNHPAADRNPTWSWDGAWLAFNSDREGQEDVFKVNLQTLDVVRLTDSPARDSDPAWMPYCDYIFFQTDRDQNYEIYRMDYEGLVEENISREPEWVDVLDVVPGFGPAVDAVFDSIVLGRGVAIPYRVVLNDLGWGVPGVSVQITAQPANGTVTIDGEGNVTYTPRAGFYGTDSFKYALV
ncbi:MAG: PD40 domain-containing protein, partial [Chloroflexi bacterium]|nr:PD40 domain-containing protein [Chloroflexota bacterium]